MTHISKSLMPVTCMAVKRNLHYNLSWMAFNEAVWLCKNILSRRTALVTLLVVLISDAFWNRSVYNEIQIGGSRAPVRDQDSNRPPAGIETTLRRVTSGDPVVSRGFRRSQEVDDSWSRVQTMLRTTEIVIAIDGDARRFGTSIESQNWLLVRQLALNPDFVMILLGKAEPAIENIVYCEDFARYCSSVAENFDIVIRHSWPPSLDEIAPKVCDAHCRKILVFPWEFGYLPTEVVSKVQHQFDEIWVPSQYVARSAILSGLASEVVRVVSPGIDCNALVEPMHQKQEIPRIVKFFFSGGLLPRKGVDILIEEWTSVFCRKSLYKPAFAELIIHTTYEFGYSDRKIKKLQSLIRKCSNVKWLRKKWFTSAEHKKLLAEADVYIAPFRSEGFGLPIVEAMATGIAVVASGGDTSSKDFLNSSWSYLVDGASAPCTLPPCKGASVCVFSPCKKRMCSCKPLAAPPVWFEPNRISLRRSMLAVFRDYTAGQVQKRRLEYSKRQAKFFARNKYCMQAAGIRFEHAVKSILEEKNGRTL